MRKIVLLFIAFFSADFANAQEVVEIDFEKSWIKWKGSALFNFNEHYGTVQFKNGHFIEEDNIIKGGEFEIDMNTIVNTDGKYSEDLVNHLKSRDFFDTENHPISKIQIQYILYEQGSNVEIQAYLTIRNITQFILISTKFETIEDTTVMKSRFILDRTRWKINYESKGYSINFKDAIISDAIEFDVLITTKKLIK